MRNLGRSVGKIFYFLKTFLGRVTKHGRSVKDKQASNLFVCLSVTKRAGIKTHNMVQCVSVYLHVKIAFKRCMRFCVAIHDIQNKKHDVGVRSTYPVETS